MKYIFGFFISLFLLSCQSSDKYKLPSSIRDAYSKAVRTADECKDLLDDYQSEQELKTFMAIYQKMPELTFDYTGVELDDEQYRLCRATKVTLDSLKRLMNQVVQRDLSRYSVPVVQATDRLIEKNMSLPFYARRDDILEVQARSDNRFRLKIFNADSRKLIYDSQQTYEVEAPVAIVNSAIYLVEISTDTPIYVDYRVNRKLTSVEELVQRDTVTVDTIPAQRGDFRAKSVDGVTLKNLFEEPRKITLRSQGKAIFSGSTRSLVALNLPANSADVIYNLRISTSDSDRDEDGGFYDRTSTKYRKIRFLGLPVYESTSNKSSLFRELLSVSHPDREEEAYCSMYVFKTAAEARKFQNNKPINQLNYNIDYSIVGTQSCNGNIPVKGMKTLYLGFENQKMTSSIYLWLEVVSAVHTTEYFKEKYTHSHE